MGIIDDFYTGDFTIFEPYHKPTKAYLQDAKIISECEEKLSSLLSDEELNLFQSFCTAKDNVNYTHNKESFCDGFRIGAQMMMDILKSDD